MHVYYSYVSVIYAIAISATLSGRCSACMYIQFHIYIPALHTCIHIYTSAIPPLCKYINVPDLHVYTYLIYACHTDPVYMYTHSYIHKYICRTCPMYMYIHTYPLPHLPDIYLPYLPYIYMYIHSCFTSAIPALYMHIYIYIYTYIYINIYIYTHLCFTSAIPAQESTCQTVYTYQPNSLPHMAPTGAIS